MNPKVFVSHASEDKDRFVTEFATKLRKKGVDAWLDKWEMLPGDSLVDKLFEEGLKEAEAVIIVLSNYSIEKPWVREELNTSIVNKINNGTKIIPVVLDKCKVPESLTSTIWEPIEDVNSYDDNFDRILSSIFGTSEKPALGSLPAHVSSVYYEIANLSKSDNLVLKKSCDFIIENENNTINPENLFENEENFGFNKSEIKDCIEILDNNGYINVTYLMGGGENNYNCHYQVSSYGFDTYAKVYLDNYQIIIEKIVSAIVNENIDTNQKLKSAIDESIIIIDNILESNGHIKLSETFSGTIIHNVSASLRRSLL